MKFTAQWSPDDVAPGTIVCLYGSTAEQLIVVKPGRLTVGTTNYGGIGDLNHTSEYALASINNGQLTNFVSLDEMVEVLNAHGYLPLWAATSLAGDAP